MFPAFRKECQGGETKRKKTEQTMQDDFNAK